MHRLINGYQKFRDEVYPDQRAHYANLSQQQNPFAMFICCADSRVNPHIITQSEPGDVFTVRNVGNIVPPSGEFTGGVSSAIEYAVLALAVPNIVVLGHSDCGAMKALLDPHKVSSMKAVSSWLQHSHAARDVVEENSPHLHSEELLRAVTEENVIMQLDHLRTHPSVAARLRKGSLKLHGWIYDIGEGTVRTWNPEKSCFGSLCGDNEDAGMFELAERLAS